MAALAIAWAVSAGELHVVLVAVFPVLYGSGPIAFVAVVSAFAAGVSWFTWSARRAAAAVGTEVAAERDRTASRPAPTQRRHGGVLLLGPLPIIWGSDPKTAFVLVVLALALMVFAVGVLLAWGRA